MRDRGFPFYWSDQFAKNLVAKGFEAREQHYDVATAFEVLEHVEHPLRFVGEIFERFSPELFLFSTVCFSAPEAPERDWWYWSFETGQHISFYSLEALEYLAKRIGCKFYNFGDDLFAFSKIDIPELSIWDRIKGRFKRQHRAGRLGKEVRPSLTFTDFEFLRKELDDREAGAAGRADLSGVLKPSPPVRKS